MKCFWGFKEFFTQALSPFLSFTDSFNYKKKKYATMKENNF